MLKKCEQCGKFFGANDNSTLCTSCKLSTPSIKSTGDPERDKYLMCKEIVYDNEDISPQGIIDIMEEAGITITLKEILRYVDEGRLSLNLEKTGNHCARCGTRVISGKYCDRCRVKMESERAMNDLKGKVDSHEQSKIKMHTSK